jgi:hypothetical protein
MGEERTMKKFKMEVTLSTPGAMKNSDDLADALESLARRIRASFPTKGTILDRNRDEVGTFKITNC